MRTLLIAMLLWLGCEALPAQTQAEMNAEAAADLARADAALNGAYRQVLKAGADQPLLLANLKEAQRAWLRYVDFHLQTLYPVGPGEDPRQLYGSVYPLDVAEAKARMYEARTAELKALLDR